jgi:hypothetical protein
MASDTAESSHQLIHIYRLFMQKGCQSSVDGAYQHIKLSEVWILKAKGIGALN